MQLIQLKIYCYIHFLIIIRRFLVKWLFNQQFVNSVKMSKFTTLTGIVLLIVQYTIKGSKPNW